MVVVGDSATSGEKELKRNYPNTEGLISGTTKQEGTLKHLQVETEDLTEDSYEGVY